MNFYPFHIGDYASATRHLSWDEDLAYRRLIDAYYTREAPIPSDKRAAYRLVCATTDSQREAVDTILEEFFVLAGDVWIHDRCEAEIHAAASKREKASQSAAARWRNANAERTQCEGNANASEKTCERIENGCEGNAPNPNPNPNPNTSNDVCTNTSHRPEYSEEFEQAWREYPGRPGSSKQAAFKAWKASIKDGSDQAQMIEGAKRYARYCEANRTEPRFIKHAATFFGPDLHFLADWSVTSQPAAANNTRRNIHDERAHTIAVLTGASRAEQQPLDITGFASRVD